MDKVDLELVELFDEGFLFDGDFSLITYAYNISPNIPFFNFYADEKVPIIGTLTYRVQGVAAGNPISYLELAIRMNEVDNYTYYITSNQIPIIDESAILGICLVRQYGSYKLSIEILGKAKEG